MDDWADNGNRSKHWWRLNMTDSFHRLMSVAIETRKLKRHSAARYLTEKEGKDIVSFVFESYQWERESQLCVYADKVAMSTFCSSRREKRSRVMFHLLMELFWPKKTKTLIAICHRACEADAKDRHLNSYFSCSVSETIADTSVCHGPQKEQITYSPQKPLLSFIINARACSSPSCCWTKIVLLLLF